MALRSLIVDDNHHFLAAAQDLLEREALVDIDLGDESGLDVARRLAGLPGEAGSRVVLISAYSETDFADLISASPAVGFLPKSALSAGTINEVLRASR